MNTARKLGRQCAWDVILRGNIRPLSKANCKMLYDAFDAITRSHIHPFLYKDDIVTAFTQAYYIIIDNYEKVDYMKTCLTVDTIMEMVTAEAAGWGKFNCKWWMEKGTPVPNT